MDPNQYLHARVKANGQLFAASVRSLAVASEYGIDLLPIGSGTLVWHRGMRYLLTAAHVLELYPGHAVYVGTNSKWVEVESQFYKTTVPKGGTREDDVWDFAFAPVPDSAAEFLDGCHFLQGDEVSLNEHVVFSPPYRSKYTAFGFPLNRFDMSYPTKTSYPKNVAYTGALASREQYKALELSVDSHVVIECDLDQVISEERVQKGPKIVGISGGGLFRMPSLERVGSVEPAKLAGLVLERDPRERLLVGVRYGVICSAIDTTNVK